MAGQLLCEQQRGTSRRCRTGLCQRPSSLVASHCGGNDSDGQATVVAAEAAAWRRAVVRGPTTCHSNHHAKTVPPRKAVRIISRNAPIRICLLYTSDAADERSSVD